MTSTGESPQRAADAGQHALGQDEHLAARAGRHGPVDFQLFDGQVAGQAVGGRQVLESEGGEDRLHAHGVLHAFRLTPEPFRLDCDAGDLAGGFSVDDRQPTLVLRFGHASRQSRQGSRARGDRSTQLVQGFERRVALQGDHLHGQTVFPELLLECGGNSVQPLLGEVDGLVQLQGVESLARLGEGPLQGVLERLVHAGEVDRAVGVEADELEELQELGVVREPAGKGDRRISPSDLTCRPEVELVAERDLLGGQLADTRPTVGVGHPAGDGAARHVVPLHLGGEDPHHLREGVEDEPPGRGEDLGGVLAPGADDRQVGGLGQHDALLEDQVAEPEEAQHGQTGQTDERERHDSTSMRELFVSFFFTFRTLHYSTKYKKVNPTG